MKPKNEKINATYFTWVLSRRDGVYYADGRSNPVSLGRYSLGTRDRVKAGKALTQLDIVKAVENGQASRALLDAHRETEPIPIQDGIRAFMDFCDRDRATGGLRPRSLKRYRAVFDKFSLYCIQLNIATWQLVDESVLLNYGDWLRKKQMKADATIIFELDRLRQINKWLIENKLLPDAFRIHMRLPKPQNKTTYCYEPEEVDAIVKLCRSRPQLKWLGNVVVALATTGMRIGELAELCWADVDLRRCVINLKDTSRQTNQIGRLVLRSTKSGKDRDIPIHSELECILTNVNRGDGGFVFRGPREGRLKPDTVLRILKRDVLIPLSEQFPGTEGRQAIVNGTVHSFRHYFCSTCADQGVSEFLLMSWLGHADSGMVRRYYHGRRTAAREQLANVKFIGGELKTSVG